MTVGVLAMAYGTPPDRAGIAAYYTDIRRGRPPAPEQLADLERRYDAIGGTFPLREITQAQVAVLRDTLGDGYAVELGQKHATPTIEEGVAALEGRGVARVVGLVLAPHYAEVSIGEYARRAAAATVPVTTIESWHLLPAYLDFLAGAVTDALAGLPGAEVVFTAHSIPRRYADAGDPYPGQLRATAEAVATLAGLDRWSVGYQSAGRTPEPWLGPDLLDLLRARAEAGERGVVVCPCGFTGDHLEVAYDLDIEAAGMARDLGLAFARTRTVGADPDVVRGLADLIRAVP